MIYSGWDTDDLTNRQHYVFCKLNNNSTSGITIAALNFLRYCIKKNHACGEFNNYEGNCDYLSRVKQETLEKCGIDLNILYN